MKFVTTKKALLLALWLIAPALSPAAQAQAPTTQTPTTLTLSAPVGSAVELLSSTSSRITMSDLQVAAVPGATPSQDKLAKARSSVEEGLAAVNEQPPTQLSGKAFFKVAGRDASGATNLVSSVIQNAPGQPAVNIKFTQTISTDGKISGLRIESENPQLKAIFKSLTPEKLQQMADQSSNNFTGVYGVPLTVDEPRTTTLTLDAQDLMSSIFSAVAGPKGQALLKDVQASPLTITTTNTYRGLNAQGLHAFDISSGYAPWTVTVKGNSSDVPDIMMELTDVKATGTQTYRKDGLPSGSSQNTAMQMKMTMTLDGVQVKVTLNLVQNVNLKPR